VPQGHKVVLVDIDEGGAIKRYGHVIGTATRPVAKGGWIEESVVRLPDAPPMDRIELATRIPARLPWVSHGARRRFGSSSRPTYGSQMADIPGFRFGGFAGQSLPSLDEQCARSTKVRALCPLYQEPTSLA
jgi:hypothetical protein